jgi:hypothetical protein
MWTSCSTGERELGEDKKGLGVIPLYSKYYDFRLDVDRRVLFKKKCVCDIGERGGEYGSRMYFYHCNGKWLLDSHVSLLMFLCSI